MDELALTREYYKACDEGDLDTVKKCVKERVDINCLKNDGWSPFIQACIKNRIAVVEYLINAGVNVAHLNRTKGTSLIGACSEGHTEVAELLLAQNSTIDFIRHQNKFGKTALMYATDGGHGEIIKLLLLYDPSDEHILMRNKYGKTAIDLAKTGVSDKIKELLKSPPKIDCKRAKG